MPVTYFLRKLVSTGGIPLAPTIHAVAARKTTESGAPYAALLLIVDGDPTDTAAISDGYEEQGYSTEVAMDAGTAFTMLDRLQPHMVMMDMTLHTGSGQEIVDAVKVHILPCTRMTILVNSLVEATFNETYGALVIELDKLDRHGPVNVAVDEPSMEPATLR